MNLSELFFTFIPQNVEKKTTKFFTIFIDNVSGKKCYLSGKRLQLFKYDSTYGERFTEITEENAKIKHLGKVRCIGVVSDENHLLRVLSKYFGFEIPEINIPISIVIKTVLKSPRKVLKKKIKKELKTDELIADRDEKQLVIAYRNAKDKRSKDKIFNTILYQRGVNGKTWNKIIKNYVSYNKHKFACYLDRTEDDFYQEIVTALHKQIDKWFDIDKQCCFSTYAWYVINCAFNRILQSLSTQKRRVIYSRDDNEEIALIDTLSIEKTQLPVQMHFEEEIDRRNLCIYINNMFELKEIKVDEELKKDMLHAIREKTTLHTSLSVLSKKHNISIDELLKIEMSLRENIKNAMYKDIIFNLQNDVNADDQIAKKYNRSKGHIIKMKKQLCPLIKSKIKEYI